MLHNLLINVAIAATNNSAYDNFDEVVHQNFVTYTWLFAAIAGAVVAMLSIFIPVFSSYSARKVNKELCERIHEENDKKITEMKNEITQICKTSDKNHNALIRIETLLKAKIRFDAARLNPDSKALDDLDGDEE